MSKVGMQLKAGSLYVQHISKFRVEQVILISVANGRLLSI